MQKRIRQSIANSISAKEAVAATETAHIAAAARAMIKTLRRGGKVLVFGNGGSAADSQHIVAELVGRFKKERRPFPAIALTTNTSTLTAIGNDYGYDVTFSRQIEALGCRGDVAIGISTSGNSPNVLTAIAKAAARGLITIGITGGTGGKLARAVDVAIIVRSSDTPRIQESHLTIGHILCELVEQELCKR